MTARAIDPRKNPASTTRQPRLTVFPRGLTLGYVAGPGGER